MTSNQTAIVTALIGSGLVSSITAAIITGWMTRTTTQDVEKLKARLNEEQERLSIFLNTGSYVTRAHYDLELEAVKAIWSLLDNLLITATQFGVVGSLSVGDANAADQSWRLKAVQTNVSEFSNAHNAAVIEIGKLAPFYPASIRVQMQIAMHQSTKVLARLSSMVEFGRPIWYEDMMELTNEFRRQMGILEDLIRKHFQSLRIKD